MSTPPRLPLIAALAALMLPAAASADSNGAAGSVEAIVLHEPGSDNHPMYHGAVVLKERAGVKREYRWGGSLCPGRELSDTSLGLLFEALRSGAQVEVTPLFKSGNGGQRCITGLRVAASR
jgi:hypothetical protein